MTKVQARFKLAVFKGQLRAWKCTDTACQNCSEQINKNARFIDIDARGVCEVQDARSSMRVQYQNTQAYSHQDVIKFVSEHSSLQSPRCHKICLR